MIEAGGLLFSWQTKKPQREVVYGNLTQKFCLRSDKGRSEKSLYIESKDLQYTIILYHSTLWIPSIPKLLFWISSNFLCKKLTPSSTGCLVIKYDFQFWLNNNEPVDDNHTNTHTYMLLYKAPPPKNQLQTVVSIFLLF